jgi:hypothetical protein
VTGGAHDTLRDELRAEIADAEARGGLVPTYEDMADAAAVVARRYADAQVAAEQEQLVRVGCIETDPVDGAVMRGHFGPCVEAGHQPIYRRQP